MNTQYAKKIFSLLTLSSVIFLLSSPFFSKVFGNDKKDGINVKPHTFTPVVSAEWCPNVRERIGALENSLDSLQAVIGVDLGKIGEVQIQISLRERNVLDAKDAIKSLLFRMAISDAFLKNLLSQYEFKECHYNFNDRDCIYLTESIELYRDIIARQQEELAMDSAALKAHQTSLDIDKATLKQLEKQLDDHYKHNADLSIQLLDANQALKTCTEPFAPLPILSGQCENGGANLQWSTPSGSNFKTFSIEKSTDGIKWDQIGSVQGQGYVTNATTYVFKGVNPNVTSNFFRVIALDVGGRKTYSALIGSPCATSTLANVLIAPNPVTSTAVVNITSLQNTPIKLTLYNFQGTAVKVFNANLHVGNNQIKMDLSSVPTGIYTLSSRWSNGRKSIKVIKN